MDSDSSPSIEVAVGNGAWRTAVTDPETLAELAARAALRDPDAIVSASPKAGGGRPAIPIEIGIRLADDAEVQGLNRLYRAQDKPTNVLSFPGDDPSSPVVPGHPLMLGDVIVAFETTTAEAAAMGKSIEAHLAHLIVHGVLHLCGHDHEDDSEAARMEAIETRVLAGLGHADPYAPSEPGDGPVTEAPTGGHVTREDARLEVVP